MNALEHNSPWEGVTQITLRHGRLGPEQRRGGRRAAWDRRSAAARAVLAQTKPFQ